MWSLSSRLVARVSLLVCALCTVATATGTRTLVVVDASVQLDRFQAFWDSLRDDGHVLTFRTAQDGTDSQNAFDQLVLFAPSAKSLPIDLAPQRLVDSLQRGVNILVVLSSELSEFWRDFAREFDVDFDDRGHALIDHFSYDTHLDDGSHTTVVLPLADSPTPFISAATQAGPPVLYRGAAHSLGRLPMLNRVLAARSTSYSYESKLGSLSETPAEDLCLAGSKIGVVSAFQARNNARVTFVGSQDLFSDEMATASVACADGTLHSHSGNAAFIKDLSRWTFGRSGVMHVVSSSLMRLSDSNAHGTYRVRDEMQYTLNITNNAGVSSVSQPHVLDDMQLEFAMLDPHLRLPLAVVAADASGARLSARFVAPDRHGVFTLRIDHRRPGWATLTDKIVVSVTPPRHDEYPRFIGGAWPYYSGALSVSCATLLFMALWVSQ